MGIAVRMLLALEELAFAFQHNDQLDVEAHILLGLGGVVGVLDELACILLVELHVDVVLHPLGVKVLDRGKASLTVDHRHLLAVAVIEQKVGNAGFLGHTCIVGTEGRCDVHDASTVLCRHIVAKNNAESLVLDCLTMCLSSAVDHGGLHPRYQLLVLQAFEFSAFTFGHEFICRSILGVFRRREHTAHKCLCHNDAARLVGIGMSGFEEHIVDVGAHAESRIARQCPRCGCPSYGKCGNARLC